jgi:CheY-like chemotaxis protein
VCPVPPCTARKHKARESIVNANNTQHQGTVTLHKHPADRSLSSTWPDFLAGQAEKPIRVMVVDDDSHVRMVIAQEVMNDHRTVVVAQASCLREARKCIRQHDFDVMLVDLNLGNGNDDGLELIDVMKSLRPTAEAIVVSVVETEEQVLRAFEVGATGYPSLLAWPEGCYSASTKTLSPLLHPLHLPALPTSFPRANARYFGWWQTATPAQRLVISSKSAPPR